VDRLPPAKLVRALWPYAALWALLALAVAGVTSWQVERGRQAALADGRVEAENLSRLLQDHTARTLDGFDRALSLMKALHEHGVGDAFLAPMSASLAASMTSEVERTFNRFDRDGILAATSAREPPAGRVTIADRAYFRQAREDRGAELRIGEPTLGRVSQVTVIPLAKRLETVDGRFDGVIAVALDPARLVQLFRSLRVGSSSSVGLVDRDGRVYVWSENATTRASEPVVRPPADRVETHAFDAALTLADIAGPDSVVALSAVPGTQLIAFAALSEEQLLGGQRRYARSLAGYAALIVALLTLSIGFLSRRALAEAKRRRVLELRYADASERARTDPLTGIANREAFDDQLRHAHAAAQSRGVPFVLAFLDVDRFKALNDRYGHEIGDRALRRVADTVAGSVRRSDVVARLGGDEFAVLMPGADAQGTVRVFDNLRETLKLAVAEEGWPISFSMGVVAFDGAPPRARDAVAVADRLMYEVKAAGRDGVRYAAWRDGRLVVDAPEARRAA
jgi:diguanylate cyclase (GGDEF)-like protein